jgi:hypothetical protein
MYQMAKKISGKKIGANVPMANVKGILYLTLKKNFNFSSNFLTFYLKSKKQKLNIFHAFF